MTLNEVLVKQNFITKILIKSEKCELNKTLKVKVMNMRIELTKIKNQFDESCIEKISNLKPKNFDTLVNKEDKTADEEKELTIMIDKLNKKYNDFLIEKGKEEIIFDKKFTMTEYEHIVDVNAGNNVNINGTELSATDFLEIVHTLFVE